MNINRKEISLDGFWQLRSEAITCTSLEGSRISRLKTGWIETPVPGDIHQGVIAAGKGQEPTLGMNSRDDAWIEDRSWWLRKTFKATQAMIDADQCELHLDGLDANASIFLNGKQLGNHPSAFRPFIMRLNETLIKGENIVLVRLTHGLENVTQKQVDDIGGKVITEAVNNNPDAGDRRRVYVRKPQYTWGWDWVPRIATVGITGKCKICVCNQAVIRDLQITPQQKSRSTDVNLNTVVEIEWFHRTQSGTGTVEVKIQDTEGKAVATVRKNVLLQSGINYIDLVAQIKKAKLWWPSQMGEQYRYNITAELIIGGKLFDHHSLKYGIRFVELDTNDKFAIRINGKIVFCKGANWIPCDALYGRVTDQRVDTLVTEAQKANFNMLRIWGGGLYELDAFYEACDREGIMIWQDFMFACAPPPDHLESFRDEIRKEADYQTRRLHNNACIVLWCGSNECVDTMCPYLPGQTENGKVTFGHILPRAVRNNCPEIPYWYASPYGSSSNWNCHDTDGIGDCHFWRDAMMNPNMKKRITPELFDTDSHARFISEYGFIGPCCEETTMQYLDGGEIDRNKKTWLHHCNSFEKGTVNAAIKKHYINPEKITTQEYLYYGGLVQGLMYSYSLETFRSQPFCYGGLFWMYNDCWGEVGWSIIDYYLRRKISWYFVRRALASRRLILRQRKGEVAVILANDTNKLLRGIMEYGYISLDGRKSAVKTKKITADSSPCSILATFAKGRHDLQKGLFFARIMGNKNIASATLRAVDFRQLKRQNPNLKYSLQKKSNSTYVLKIKTDVYAHAVKIDLPKTATPEDNYFDILPNTKVSVVINSFDKLEQNDIAVTVCK